MASVAPAPAQAATTVPTEALQSAIALLESHRAALGDAVVDLALEPLRRQLASRGAAGTLQRRLVTVLFVDIAGSTALAQRVDAEDLLAVLDACLKQAAAAVQAHGGRVLRYTGDGLKAAFGVDAAAEDDAVRALHAGLAIVALGRSLAQDLHRRRGLEGFALRVGAHTGEVALGAGFESADTLSGEAVHIAARMEQHAPPGGFLVSAETWAHARGRFAGQVQPPLWVKGLARPLHTVRVLGTAEAAGAEAGDGPAVPLVGRRAELDRLLAALEPGAAAPAVVLLADAGLGKSRLLHEALQRAGAAGALATRRVLVARAQPDARLRPWGLLRQLLGSWCGLAGDDASALAGERFVARLGPGFARDGEGHARRIGQLIGLDLGDEPSLQGLDPRLLRDRALAALHDWLTASGDADPGLEPALLVLEDLHWADDASLDWVQSLLARGPAGAGPALWASARPVLRERRGDWPADALWPLAPLDTTEGPALADALLAEVASPPEALRRLLVDRAAGNPYFMQELMRRLRDDGVLRREGARWLVDAARLASVQLPTTLVALLQARLDALPPAERRAARLASVVGAVFWDAALAAVDASAAAALPTLARRQWIHAQSSSAFADCAEHRFDHHLLHQVTYGTLTRAEREPAHAAVARWLRARITDRAPELLAVAAEHAERGGELAQAIDDYEAAAEEARRRHASRLALDCAERAQALLAQAPQPDVARRARLLHRVQSAADTLGDRALQRRALEQAQALLAERAREHGRADPAFEAKLAVSRALLEDRVGDLDAAAHWAQQAISMASRAGAVADGDAALAHAELAWIAGLQDDNPRARTEIDAALALAARARERQPDVEVRVLAMAGLVELRDGATRRAIARLGDALARAEALGERLSQLGILDQLCACHLDLGEWDAMAAVAERFVALARELGALPRLGHALRQQAAAACGRGDAAAARACAEQSVQILRRCGEPFSAARSLGELGQALRLAGEASAARQAFARAEAQFATLASGQDDALCMAAFGAQLDSEAGDTALALAAVERVLDAIAQGVLLCDEDTLPARWACCQVLSRAGDARAAAMLAGLHAEVQAVLARLAGPGPAAQAERQRLLAALPALGAIVAAHAAAA